MDDKEQIRALVATWLEATRTGDAAMVLSLIAEDAVFLLPGGTLMRKHDFEAASGAPATAGTAAFDASSDIQEIRVLGDWAFMWARMRVVATPADGGEPMVREGHTLSVLRKEGGRWRLARDANLLQ